MPSKDREKWYSTLPPWPIVPIAMDVFRSVPAKIASRLMLVVTSFAWCLIALIVITVTIEGSFAEETKIYQFCEQLLDEDTIGVPLATLFIYTVVVGLRILWRIVRPSSGPDERFWLKVLDEMSFPAWSMISANKRFFAPLNFIFTIVPRYVLSTQRRAINFFVAFAVLASIVFIVGLISRIVAPTRTLFWGNQWGSGVRAFGTGTWLLWAALIATIILLFLLFAYIGFIIQAAWNAIPFLLLAMISEEYGIRVLDWTADIIVWTPEFVASLNAPTGSESGLLGAIGPAIYEALHFDIGIYTIQGGEMSLLGLILLGLIASVIPMAIRRFGMLPKVEVFHHPSANVERGEQRYTLQAGSSEIVDKVALHDSRPAFVIVAIMSLACMAVGFLSPLYTSVFGAILLIISVGLTSTAVFVVNYMNRPRARSELVNQDGFLIWEARAIGRKTDGVVVSKFKYSRY